MAVQYELHEIENSKGSGETQAYVRLSQGRAMSPEQLTKAIEATCTLTDADVKAAMAELCYFAVRELQAGRRFHLPEIGYLSLSAALNSTERDTDDTTGGEKVVLRGINFRPERRFLQKVRNGLTFEKSGRTTSSTRFTDEELTARVTDYLGANRYLTCRALMYELGVSEYTARQALARLVEIGVLVREGTARRYIYFLA